MFKQKPDSSIPVYTLKQFGAYAGNTDKLAAIRAIHSPTEYVGSLWCQECEKAYPCRTIQELDK